MFENTLPFRLSLDGKPSPDNHLTHTPIPSYGVLGNADNDTPEQFIKKMKNTLSKKKKNNFKNIKELENIYESTGNTKPAKTEKVDNDLLNIKSSVNALDKSIQQIEDSINKVSEKTKKPKPPLDNIEGFSNTDIYDSIYKPEYEFETEEQPVTSTEYAKLVNDAKSGLLNTTLIKQLMNIGKITLAQYNELFGFTLDFSGFEWKNASTTPPKPTNERCSKWNKNCEGGGADIIEWLKRMLDNLKKIIGIYSQLLRFIAVLIYKSVDGSLEGNPSNSNDDVSIIVNVLHFLIMIPLSIYFAYNWFYITFYKDETGEPLTFDFSEKVMTSLKGLLIRLFKCLVQPMILMDSFIRLFIPKSYYTVGEAIKSFIIGPLDFSFIGNIMTNPLFIFIWFTLLILHMTCKYSDTISNMFMSYMTDAKVPYESYLHGIIAYDWIIGIAAIGIFGKVFGLIETVISPLSAIFWFLVLVIFSHLMIRFAGIFIILYLYAMSYFALSIYSKGGITAAIKSINLAFEASIRTSNVKCPEGEWEKSIKQILELVYKYLYAILYIIVLGYSAMWIFASMKSSSGKIILGSTLSLIIAIIVLAIVYVRVAMGESNIEKSDIDI